ncbi:MAG TPA: LamG domain-containing protein [Panacibacter sp.]|nr:LamG domain-containing protein [Panacibacter sp.]
MSVKHISFTVSLNENDWSNDFRGWVCSSLRIPGAEIKEIFSEGKKVDDINYKIDSDKSVIRWANQVIPKRITVCINLKKELTTTDLSKRWKKLAIILAFLGPLIGSLVTGYFTIRTAEIKNPSYQTDTSSVGKIKDSLHKINDSLKRKIDSLTQRRQNILNTPPPSWVNDKKNLVAWFSFEHSADDALKRKYNPFTNGNIQEAFGRNNKGKAFKFGRADTYIKYELNSDPDFLNGNFTISCWFYLNTEIPADQNRELLSFIENSQNSLFVGFKGSNARFTPDWSDIPLSVDIKSKTWYMISFVSSNDNAYVYLNGQQVSQPLGRALKKTERGKLIIGGQGGNPSEYFDGIIDEVRLYKIALSNTEISTLYEYER